MKLRTFGDSVRLLADRRDLVDGAREGQTPGYASRPTLTAGPTRRSFMSAWLTRARTRMTAGFTTSTTGWPGRTSSPSMNSTMLPPFFHVVFIDRHARKRRA